MRSAPSSERAHRHASLDRAGARITVVVPCTAPADLHLVRRSDAPAPGAAPPDAPLTRTASVGSSAPERAASMLRSARFRSAALAVLDVAPSVTLDGRTARASAPALADDRAVQELAKRLGGLSAVVRALASTGSGAREPTFAAAAHEGAVPAEGELVFYGPLLDLCAIGLYRPAMEALCAGRRDHAAPPMDRGYLLKVLEEEIGRQFGQPLRPIVELVLNAVDAVAPAGEAPPRGGVVHVELAPAEVMVTDAGQGMSLRTILSRLLVPFATDKRPGLDLGRFGVGFFSVLGFGLAHPESFSLRVWTGDGREAWILEVIAAGPSADALLCSIRRAPAGPAGTRVAVATELCEPETLRAYLRDALHFLPSARAVVRVDGVPLNDGSLIAGGQTFEDVAAAGDPPLLARYHLFGRALAPGINAATYHAGVKVESCLAIGELALIDFPGAVELTEGRDALKPGPELDAVVVAFHRRLARLGRGVGVDRSGRDRLAELAAQVSSMLLQSAAWREVAPEIARELLGPRYLVGPDRAEPLVGFLGARVAARLFVPDSFWAEREWYGVLPGERELLDAELEVDPPEPLGVLAQRRPDLAGLGLLLGRPHAGAATVSLARPRHGGAATAPGALPCFGARRAILVREDAAVVRAPRGWADRYALRTSFDRAAGMREPDVERELIVADPVGSARAGR